MPRFTVKDLLIATTLIAVGTAMLAYGIAPTIIIGVALIGAGIGTPFHRQLLGAYVVFVLMAVAGLARFAFYLAFHW